MAVNAGGRARTKGLARRQPEHNGEAELRLTSGGRAAATLLSFGGVPVPLVTMARLADWLAELR